MMPDEGDKPFIPTRAGQLQSAIDLMEPGRADDRRVTDLVQPGGCDEQRPIGLVAVTATRTAWAATP